MKFNKLVLVISSIAIGYVNCSGKSASLSVDQDFQNLVSMYKENIVASGQHLDSDDIAFVMARYPEIGSAFLSKLGEIRDDSQWYNINALSGTIVRKISRGEQVDALTRALKKAIESMH